MERTTGRPVTVLLAPDKFKGTLSAAEVAHALGAGLAAGAGPGRIRCRYLPLADGGDGSVQAALHAGFAPVSIPVHGPVGAPATTTAAVHAGTAVVEVATTAGLQMLPPASPAPLDSSSRGFGQALAAVLDRGPERVVLALGGSASTDGGAGMLSELGVRFLDASGAAFVPTGATLRRIARIDPSGLVPLRGIELVAASDVQNALLGPAGAAAVYGPQKGATAADVHVLEHGLRHLVDRVDAAGWPGSACAAAAGSGSAGGLGFATLVLGARLVSGAGFFLDLLGFDRAVADCDLVITGEGRLDEQTLAGKLPVAVARRAAPVPVIAVVGENALGVARLPDHHLGRVHSLREMDARDSAADPSLTAVLLRELGRRLGRWLTAGCAAPPH